jgi:hypothetical protein
MAISVIVNKRQKLTKSWFEPALEFSEVVHQLTESGAIVSRTVEESQDGYTQTITTEFQTYDDFRKFSQLDVVKNSVVDRTTYNSQNDIECQITLR